MRVSKLTYLLFLFLLGLAAGYGWLTYNDSSSLDASKQWCDDGLRGLKFEAKPARIDCHYEAFISMCVVDAFAAVGLLLLAVCTVLYKHNADPAATKGPRSKKAKKQRSGDDEDDEDEEESDPLLNKAGNGVGTYVYEDFVTPKNRNSINTAYGDVSYDDDDEDNGDSSGTVDFDSESKKRYPQLERRQQQGNGDTQFEQVDEQPKKKQGGRKQQQEQQVKRKESGRVAAKHSNPNDIDFSKLAEENEAASRKSGGGRVAQSGFQSALDMQAERMPPPQQSSQGQVRKKNSGVIGIQKQAPPPPPQKVNNGDFDFESLEGNNGFEDD